MKPLDQERQAVEKFHQESDRAWERLQVSQRAHQSILDELAVADVDFPDFPRLVARREVERARVEVLEPRARLARDRWDEARKNLARLEQRAAAPAPAPAKSSSSTGWEL